jgi:CheY-like chemotaxis protein
MNKIDLLLVEDNLEDGELTLRALKKNKLANQITWLKNGEEAIDFFKNTHVGSLPKLILLDLKMPKVSGLDVLKFIRTNKKTKNLNVVVLTSSKQEQDLINTYELGVNSYIVKPVEFNKFIDAVKEIGFYWLMLNERPNEF